MYLLFRILLQIHVMLIVKEVSADVQGVSGELFLIYASNIIH